MEDTIVSGSPVSTLNVVPRVAVVGVGGAGCAVVDHIYWKGDGVETVAINTDRASLEETGAHRKVFLCSRVTRGEGAKGDQGLGRSCAQTHSDEIADAIRGNDIVYIVAGMGGGTGTGAAPVVAEVARRLDMITFAIAINPFSFESGRTLTARDGIRRLRAMAPLTMVMENDLLLQQSPDASLSEAFDMANAGISEYISKSTRRVTEAFVEQLARIEVDVGASYGEWPATDTDTIRILFP